MIRVERGGLRLLLFPSLEPLEAHGFRCAVSTAPLDVRERAHRDRFAAAAGFDPARVASVRQIHHADVVQVRREPPRETPPADALITDAPGVALLVRAADCSLVVVADPDRRAVGVAHAGWRGSARGVVVQLVRAMRAAYGTEPERCLAAVGPTISQDRYPVGPEVPAAFLRSRAWAQRYVAVREDRLHFDLSGANARFLVECGVPEANVERSPLCTYDEAGLLHSYRRSGPSAGHHALVAGWLEG